MTDETADQTRDGAPGDVPRAPADTTRPYPPEADPEKAGDVAPAEVAGEQTDPTRRLTGGDLPVDDSPTTPSTPVTPATTESR